MGKRERSGSPELPHHIIAGEILTRLPVKSLSRFRCVSKPWCSLISDPHFQMEHLRRSQQSPLLLVAKSEKHDAASSLVRFSTYTNDGDSLLKEFFKIFTDKEFFKIFTDKDINHKATFDPIQSCLGLVCLRNIMDGAIHVFNPSSEEAIILPERPDQEFDLCIGFGYTDSTREFKVFRIFNRYGLEDQDCCCEVFTLGDPNGWRSRNPPPYRPSLNTHLPLLHGALHFLPSLYFHEQERQHHYITAIHVDTEDYTPIPLPDIYFGSEATALVDQCQLAEFRGSLCLSFDFYYSKSSLQLWLMEDYRSCKWVKGYNIDLSAKPLFFSPLAITLDGCILLSTRSASPKELDELCYYHTQKNCITKTIGKDCSAIFYIESFMPLRRSPQLEPV